MKKRLLIICSIIGVLLAGFQFPIYAEETTPDYSSSTSIITNAALDQYFYDNYDLLPYIESSGSQYINTSINASSELLVNLTLSNLERSTNSWIFGSCSTSNSDRLSLLYQIDDGLSSFNFYNSLYNYSIDYSNYDLTNIKFDKNEVFVNDSLVHTFNDASFTSSYPIYLFTLNYVGTDSALYSSYRLYKFSIYDYAANDGKGALVRDYYPARSKSSGIIGLYDAVNKTFVTTSGSVPFASPTGDSVNLSLGANITQFLSGSLSWIGAIFEGINEMPIIWVFIAIALAGVMFRWARRIVHF